MSEHEPRCTGTKQCSDCERVLHVLAFPAATENSDGLSGRCRECWSDYNRLRNVDERERERRRKRKLASNSYATYEEETF